MNMHERFAQPDATAARADLLAAPSSRQSWVGSLWTWLAARVKAYAAYDAAATAYTNLACLSDGELTRLGLSRETLARDLNDMERDQASGRDPS